MSIILEEQEGAWYSARPRGGVYDLVYAALSGTDTAARLRSVAALGKSDDPRAVRPLMDLLSNAEPEIRLAATTALGQLKSGRPVDDLIGRLRDHDEQMVTREQAVVALVAIRSTGAIRKLREFVADDHEDPALRSYTGNLLSEVKTW